MEESTPTGVNELQIQLLQAAICALFSSALNKAALRHEFLVASDRILSLQLKYPVSETALANVQNMRQVFLEMLE